MHRIFGGIRAPSTCGTFLRTFTFGHVLQLQAVARRLLANLSGHAPLLPGADQISFLDIDDTMKATYGYAKQGAGYGYNGVKGLNALLGTITTPTRAPLIRGALLRKGSTSSARGAARFLTSCVHTPKVPGLGGTAASSWPGVIRRSTPWRWWPPPAGRGPVSRSPPARTGR